MVRVVMMGVSIKYVDFTEGCEEYVELSEWKWLV